MSLRQIMRGASCALAALAILLTTGVAGAQGSVTPSYGDGTLTLTGEGYRPGEQVEITVRVAGSTQPFLARADARGRFRLATGLQIAPMSRIEIEARDEQGMTQVTTTSGPGALPGPGSGMPLPAPGGGMPRAAPGGGMPLPAELPRAGNASVLPLGLVSLAIVSIVGGLVLCGRAPSRREGAGSR
ncbi:MAG TPA: hypothetical protein VFH48_14400 [Chloroflexota bacterium]|nr:hypothetical protein [Chloroflexota bacterium]